MKLWARFQRWCHLMHRLERTLMHGEQIHRAVDYPGRVECDCGREW